MSASASRPELSIVIPAYNEARRLPESFARLYDYLQRQPFLTEVIVVDDGSDDSTAAVVRAWMGRWHALRLVEQPHAGKGAAVRAGALAAQGEWIFFADADFSMPVQELALFSPAEDSKTDILIGSREAPGAQRIGEPTYRHLMGRAFNFIVRRTLVRGISDTQCGFKRVRRDIALDLFFHQTITGWGFDVELLYVAQLRGYTIREAPISWYYKAGSKVRPIRDTLSMARDLFTIRRNAREGVYTRRIFPHPSYASEVPPITLSPEPGATNGAVTASE
ncbi:MAG TPA: glycosyltransferase [Ktedonobacterales bacterium]|nr:glycosyltransferase [Ktedonobacterales bacterium]